MARQPALIDFEASCLPSFGASFPIEVALAQLDGTSHDWLIRPAPEWEFWHWSDEAEALHGIERDQVEREGIDPARVLAELTQAAQGFDIYADSEMDAYWLETLATACGEKVPFPIRYFGELLAQDGFAREEVVRALDEARLQMPAEHRARDDASRLALTYKLLQDRRPAAS